MLGALGSSMHIGDGSAHTGASQVVHPGGGLSGARAEPVRLQCPRGWVRRT